MKNCAMCVVRREFFVGHLKCSVVGERNGTWRETFWVR